MVRSPSTTDTARSNIDLMRIGNDVGRHSRQALEEFARARWAAELEDRYLTRALGIDTMGAVGENG